MHLGIMFHNLQRISGADNCSPDALLMTWLSLKFHSFRKLEIMHDSLISSIINASSLNIVCDLGAPSHKIICAWYCVTAVWPNARYQFIGVPDVPLPATVYENGWHAYSMCCLLNREFTHPWSRNMYAWIEPFYYAI